MQSSRVTNEWIAKRAEALFADHCQRIYRRTDRLFAILLLIEWIVAVATAYWISPLTWAGRSSSTHIHLWAAFLVGGPIALFPALLAQRVPGRAFTRYTIATGQMMMSGLLIQISGGRIETHFHVFGSLAFLAFYRDWRVFVPATVVVAADHYFLGVYWPQAVYGVLTVTNWRWLEHAAWVAFEDVFLVMSCVQGKHEMKSVARQQAELEFAHDEIEHIVIERTSELTASEARLRSISAASPIGIFQMDGHGRCVYANERWQQITGLGVTGDGVEWTRIVHAAERDAVVQDLRASIDAPTEREREFRLVRSRDDLRWVHCRLKPLLANGQLLGHVGSLEDVTERKLAERRLAAQHAVTRLLSELTTLTDAAPRVLAPVCEALEWDVGAVWIPREDGAALRCVGVWHRPEIEAAPLEDTCREEQFASGVGLPGRIWASGMPAWIRDVTEDTIFPRSAVAAGLGLRGALGVPIMLGSHVLGVIEFFHREICSPDEKLLATMASIGGQIGQFVDRKRAERAQRQLEARVSALVEQARDGIVFMDLGGVVCEFNPAAERLFGWGRDEVVGRVLSDVLLPQHSRAGYAQALEQHRDGASESDVGTSIEISALNRSGEEIPIELSISTLRTSDASLFSAIIRDVSERKQLELELHHAQKLEAVGHLAAGIAHEINTPIQFVGDNVRFLRDGFASLQCLVDAYQSVPSLASEATGDPRIVERIRRAEEAADLVYLEAEIPKAIAQTLDGVGRVATIVRAMKEFAHPDSGEKAVADLNKALTSTLTVARNELKYVADVETDLGDIPSVSCHLGDLNQVFLNLLVNAAHAIGDTVKESGGKGRIGVRTTCEGDNVCVAISDTGGGIPEHVRSKIFDPFFTTKEVGRGTGQGLAIARSIVVDKHGGSLTFETEVGEGTTFFVRLPVDGTPSAREIAA